MTVDGDRLRLFASRLRALMARPVESEADLRAWYEEAAVLQNDELAPQMPEILYHYLADADVRLKDRLKGHAAYAQMQEAKMRALTDVLAEGRLP